MLVKSDGSPHNARRTALALAFELGGDRIEKA